ncbi:MAG TPA: response regulator transcription factor [Terriglobales bacterium]|nr:response regulator transcription factor [Terriglobales bacterium]
MVVCFTLAEAALQRTEMKIARLLIVDDHEIFRRGLRALLEPSSEWQICGEAVDGVDAVEQCKSLKPDIVVLDVSMPRLNGLEAARLIRKESPEPQIVIITQHDSPQIRSAALEAGAQAFVTKSSVGSELVSALRNLIHHPSE